MKKIVSIFSIGLVVASLAFSAMPAKAVEVIDDCNLKKKCFLRSGCKEKAGGCCIDTSNC